MGNLRKEKKEIKEKKKKRRRRNKQTNKQKTTYSLPSLRERSETPGALDRRALRITGDTRCPATVFGFGPHYCRPGSSRIDSVRGGRTRDSIIIQIPVCKRMSHLNFPPKPCSNSIFIPVPQPSRP